MHKELQWWYYISIKKASKRSSEWRQVPHSQGSEGMQSSSMPDRLHWPSLGRMECMHGDMRIWWQAHQVPKGVFACLPWWSMHHRTAQGLCFSRMPNTMHDHNLVQL